MKGKLIGLTLIAVLMIGTLTAAAPAPLVTIDFLNECPSTMNVGDLCTVVAEITSDQEFVHAQMLPDFYYPGRGVVAIRGGDHAGSGTTATLEITFRAKGSTDGFDGGVAPVAVVAGVRYKGGYVVAERFDFYVAVP